jgi:hypothetical protein
MNEAAGRRCDPAACIDGVVCGTVPRAGFTAAQDDIVKKPQIASTYFHSFAGSKDEN